MVSSCSKLNTEYNLVWWRAWPARCNYFSICVDVLFHFDIPLPLFICALLTQIAPISASTVEHFPVTGGSKLCTADIAVEAHLIPSPTGSHQTGSIHCAKGLTAKCDFCKSMFSGACDPACFCIFIGLHSRNSVVRFSSVRRKAGVSVVARVVK